MSDRSVRTFLKELRDNRLITWKQRGLNRPNVYYLLKLPDAPIGQPGTAKFSSPDRQPTSGQDRQPASDKKYSKKNTNIVNVINTSPLRIQGAADKQRAEEDYLVSEILAVCGDGHSTGLYRRIARLAPHDLIYETLSETKDRANMGRVQKSRGAVFTDLIKRRARELGIDLGLR